MKSNSELAETDYWHYWSKAAVLNLFWSRPHFWLQNISGPTRTTTCQNYLFFLRHYTAYYHGRRKDLFLERATRRFFQKFSRGGQKWQNLFFPTPKKSNLFLLVF